MITRSYILRSLAAVAVLSLVGCISAGSSSSSLRGGSPEAWAAISNGAPVRVAVYVDNGARSVGMYRWLQHMTLSPDVAMSPVDGQAIRSGALDNFDLLVMPGGRATFEAVAMDKKGIDRLKSFIRNGGSYLGTCAGCFLLMQYSREKCPCEILPYTFWRENGKVNGKRGSYLPAGDKAIVFNPRAAELCGISGVKQIRYHGGPVMMPTGEKIDGACIETLATYAPDTKCRPTPGVKIGDCAACVGGTYGKGRVFALAVHPESDSDDTPIIQGAIRYLTGRTLSFPEPVRRPGRLRVGVYCNASFGVDTAKWLQALMKDPRFDLYPVNGENIAGGSLDQLDAVLLPDVPATCRGPLSEVFNTAKPEKSITIARMRMLMTRGGKVITWGCTSAYKTLNHANRVKVASADEALAKLAGLKPIK